MDLNRLVRALRASWDADTAQLWRETWSWSNPARGQCATSSLVVADHYGGHVLRGLTNHGVVHYWNELESGAWIDVTRDQFADDEVVSTFVRRPEEQLWRFPDTVRRYELLRSRVDAYLQDDGDTIT